MFCKVHGWYRFQCLVDTRVICEPSTFEDFHLYHPKLLGILTLPPAGRKKIAFQSFNRYRKVKIKLSVQA